MKITRTIFRAILVFSVILGASIFGATTVFAQAPLAACNALDVVGNGGDLTEGPSNTTPQGLGWDVGEGQCNGSFTVTLDGAFPSPDLGPGTEIGIELGLRAINRFTGTYVRSVGTNYTSYEVDLGYLGGIPTSGSIWGFQHSIAYDGSIGDLDSLTFIIETADGTSVPIAGGIYDMLLLRSVFLDDRNGSPANPTPEWNDLYQTSQAPAFNTAGWLLNAAETGLYDVFEEGAWWFRITAEKEGNTAEAEICIHSPNADCDSDNDGVDNRADICPNTVIPEGVVPLRSLKPNRWALVDVDGDFDTVPKGQGRGPNRSYSIEDTAGCSCEQIIENQELGDGHTKFGCSISAMDDWVDAVNMP